MIMMVESAPCHCAVPRNSYKIARFRNMIKSHSSRSSRAINTPYGTGATFSFRKFVEVTNESPVTARSMHLAFVVPTRFASEAVQTDIYAYGRKIKHS